MSFNFQKIFSKTTPTELICVVSFEEYLYAVGTSVISSSSYGYFVQTDKFGNVILEVQNNLISEYNCITVSSTGDVYICGTLGDQQGCIWKKNGNTINIFYTEITSPTPYEWILCGLDNASIYVCGANRLKKFNLSGMLLVTAVIRNGTSLAQNSDQDIYVVVDDPVYLGANGIQKFSSDLTSFVYLNIPNPPPQLNFISWNNNKLYAVGNIISHGILLIYNGDNNISTYEFDLATEFFSATVLPTGQVILVGENKNTDACVVSFEDNQFSTLFTYDNLANDIFYSVVQDSFGNIFMCGGTLGLNCFIFAGYLNPCLLKSSQILTDKGYKSIEDLDIRQDKVLTVLTNEWSAIKQVVKQSLKLNSLVPTNKPYIIKKDFFGIDLPINDVFISGHHRVILQTDVNMYEGVHTYKLPGCNVYDCERANDMVDYYHVELERNYGFYVSNIAVESFNMAMHSKL